jgi:hypothetical protein
MSGIVKRADRLLGVCRRILATKLDGEMQTGNKRLLIPLVRDGATHLVQVVLGSSQ